MVWTNNNLSPMIYCENIVDVIPLFVFWVKNCKWLNRPVTSGERVPGGHSVHARAAVYKN